MLFGVLLLLILTFSTKIFVRAENLQIFEGDGTKENPYLIEDSEDLILLSNLVNTGERFYDKYFIQTGDIDLQDVAWVPIGSSKENAFFGIYNGNGYTVENICVDSYYGSFIGALGGSVLNLEVTDSVFSGTISGSIVGESADENASVINCHSNNNIITGSQAGGIAGCFSEGSIAMCWGNAEVSGDLAGGILGNGGDVKIYSCYTTNQVLCPVEIVGSLTSYTIEKEDLASNLFKLNVKVALTQVLFADHVDINLKSWSIDESGALGFDDNNEIIRFFQLLDEYLLTIILIIIMVAIAIRLRKYTLKQIWENYNKTITSGMIISFIVSFFVDMTAIKKGMSILNWGNASFIFFVNFIFICLTYMTIKYAQIKKIKISKKILPMLFLIMIVVILELLQFDLVPKYDATLYYGSLLRGIDLFDLSLFSYIGAFVCWKWIQGLALLIVPFELIFEGQMIGVYIANLVITVITLICLYFLLKEIFPKISTIFNTLICAIFIFSPYCLGLYTYLCMDWHLSFFIIWLLYGVKKKNNLWISFCGYLLAFTKITGLFFYAIILLTVALCEVVQDNSNRNFFMKIFRWWKWKKVLLWIAPAVLFCLTFIFGNYLTVQNFMGSPYNPTALFGFFDKYRFLNLFFQGFIFGFRWLFLLLLIVGVIFLFVKKNKKIDFISPDGRNLIIGIIAATVITFFILCILNSDAECPRYTAIFNITYALLIPISIYLICDKEFKRIILASIVGLILFVQTFWTIDPSIIFLTDSFDTGKKNIYKLCMPGDTKTGMNLGENYAGMQVIGDLYAYNMEYAFYDNLLDQMLTEIHPTESDTFYVLDIIDYELHLCGSANRNYKIYWNTQTQNRTYDKKSKESIYLNETSIRTEDLCASEIGTLDMPEKFYLIAVSRIDATKAIERLREEGYKLNYELHPENIYGSMSVFEFEK